MTMQVAITSATGTSSDPRGAMSDPARKQTRDQSRLRLWDPESLRCSAR